MHTLVFEELDADELFARTEEACNKDLFDMDGDGSSRIKYLYASLARGEVHLTVSLDRRIIGIAALRVNPWDETVLWIKYISVEAAHQGEGLGRRLSEAVFEYAFRHGKKLHPSSFMPMGEERLLPIFRAFASQHRQSFCDCEKCEEQLG